MHFCRETSHKIFSKEQRGKGTFRLYSDSLTRVSDITRDVFHLDIYSAHIVKMEIHLNILFIARVPLHVCANNPDDQFTDLRWNKLVSK